MVLSFSELIQSKNISATTNNIAILKETINYNWCTFLKKINEPIIVTIK